MKSQPGRPDGYREYPVRPAVAFSSPELGEFALPYETVPAREDPGQILVEFRQSTHEAAATCASWDRVALECPGEPAQPGKPG